MDDIRDTFMNAVDMYGAESIELEFRRKITRAVHDKIITMLTTSPHVSPLGKCVTREELGDTDARDVSFPDGPDHAEPYTMYKRRLCSMHLGPTRVSVALERRGDPDGTPKKVFRIKTRHSFQIDGIWRIDLTRVETNDPRYLDDDEYAYELEIEFITTSEGMYVYTIDHILNWGRILIDEMYDRASSS